MKKIISLLLVIAMTVLAFASCGNGCENHVDDDGDGICDTEGCSEKVEPKDDPDAAMTEDEWKAAFDFSNVTVTMAQTYSEDGEPHTQNVTYRFVEGHLYGLFDDKWQMAPDGYEASITYMFDFSDEFSEFTFDNGVYKATRIVLDTTNTGMPSDVSVTAENIVVTIANGKVSSINYGGSTTHGDDVSSGVVELTFSDYGTTEAPVIEELLTEDEWEAAFDFENVTISLEEGESIAEIEDVGTLYVYDGDWYMEYEGQVADLSMLGMQSIVQATLDFSDYFDEFEYNDGKYTCALIEVNIPIQGDVEFENIEITFDGTRIEMITYYSDDGYEVLFCRATFSDYGTTEEPDVAQPDSATNATYNGNGIISFEYPDNFTRDDSSGGYANDSIYSSNFIVQTLPKTNEFNNMTADEYKALLSEQGEASGLEVIACEFENKNNGTFDILVISISSRIMSLRITQVQYIVHVGSYTVVISCTAYENADTSFMETIFNSMAPAIPRTGF